MKFLVLTVFLSAALLFQCEKKEANVSANGDENSVKTAPGDPETAASKTPEKNAKNMDEVFRSGGKKGDLEFQIVGKKQDKGKYDGINYPNDSLAIEYTVKNTGAKDFILYNQGHSDNGNRQLVYVEPNAGGSVELSQKAFVEPTGCPMRDAPITPRGAWLKAGQTISGKALVELPLKQKTPFDDCAPLAEIAPQAGKIKFCLGVQETGGADTKISDKGIISPLPNLAKQEFLCSETFEIK